MRRCNINGNCRVGSIPWIVVLAAVGVLAAKVLSGAGTRPTDTSIREPREREMMRDFALPDLEGKIWKLQEHKGNVVMINFWATWCPPCRQETPDLVEVAKYYSGKGVDVAGISLDEDTDAVRRFVQEQQIPYPILLPRRDSPVIADITAIPVTVLVDKQGRVAWKEVGTVRRQEVTRLIDALLSEE
jgi:peroxiredoxin